ncbi:MAG TPA: type II toxin-antitoxin system RelE/ParE family toxin [Pirellulales bacterium]|nr:type II toxin-antitoxin system RelE/ParE family toxin [Pirellulales bacterium]
MSFTVIWTKFAESDLADIWLRAVNRREIAEATSKLDAVLKSDPHNSGESRTGNVRITFSGPLGIHFEVLAADRIVYVLAVWRIDHN